MKDNIDKALDFMTEMFLKSFYFASLMLVISFISKFFIGIFNEDIAEKVFIINISIGLIPFVIIFLLFSILILIECIIYD